jgi:hypothetical protein
MDSQVSEGNRLASRMELTAANLLLPGKRAVAGLTFWKRGHIFR